MNGFEAISHHNGWTISAIGVSIVFTALVSLSFVIAQLHKILDVWERKDEYLKKAKKRLKHLFSQEKPKESHPKLKSSESFSESARQINLLVQSMNDPFSLPSLISLAKKIDIGRPHSTINELLSAKLILPNGKGYYYWDHSAYQNLIEKE